MSHPPEFRGLEPIVKYLEHLAVCMRGTLRQRPSAATMRITQIDAEVVQQAAEMLALALEPHTHIAKAGRDPRELRYSARDVEAMIDVALALQRHRRANLSAVLSTPSDGSKPDADV